MPPRVEVQGLDKVKRAEERLRQMEASQKLAPKQLAREAAKILRRALREEAPHRTGRLQKSITYRVTGGQNPVVHFRAKWYSRFVIKGTRPHHEPGGGIFSGRLSEHVIMALPSGLVSGVNHPGAKGQDFRQPAWRRVDPEIRAKLRETGHGILRGKAWSAGDAPE